MQRTYSDGWKDYELLDAGNGKKLERWGDIITIRPDVNAYFMPAWPFSKWKKMAALEFVEESKNKGAWEQLKNVQNQWHINFQQLKFKLELTRFKHVGIFPEQQTNWEYIASGLSEGDRFLNLFGYTGAASIVARSVGAEVFHCDSVKQVINWTKENMELSGLNDIRWVLEDALKFAQREVKRGNTYNGLVMDPPAYGIGAKKERWKIEDQFPVLLEASLSLVPKGFIIINTYSPRLTEKEISKYLKEMAPNRNYSVTKLAIKSSTGKVLEYGELTRIEN